MVEILFLFGAKNILFSTGAEWQASTDRPLSGFVSSLSERPEWQRM